MFIYMYIYTCIYIYIYTYMHLKLFRTPVGASFTNTLYEHLSEHLHESSIKRRRRRRAPPRRAQAAQ